MNVKVNLYVYLVKIACIWIRLINVNFARAKIVRIVIQIHKFVKNVMMDSI